MADVGYTAASLVAKGKAMMKLWDWLCRECGSGLGRRRPSPAPAVRARRRSAAGGAVAAVAGMAGSQGLPCRRWGPVVRLASHGTGGARLRYRHHCGEHRALTFRGLDGGDAVFVLHATDGRTYEARLDADDMAAVKAAERECRRAAKAGAQARR